MRNVDVLIDRQPTDASGTVLMKALVFHGPGQRSWENKPKPTVGEPGDAIVRITTSTICGTDLHILKGDVSSVTAGRIRGHGLLRLTPRQTPTLDVATPDNILSTLASMNTGVQCSIVHSRRKML